MEVRLERIYTAGELERARAEGEAAALAKYGDRTPAEVEQQILFMRTQIVDLNAWVESLKTKLRQARTEGEVAGVERGRREQRENDLISDLRGIERLVRDALLEIERVLLRHGVSEHARNEVARECCIIAGAVLGEPALAQEGRD